MGIREWHSRLKKKLKRSGSNKHKPDRPGTEPGGEIADSASSLVQPPPHVVTGGGPSQGVDGTNPNGQQVYSVDGLPPPDIEQVPVRGGDNDQEGEAGVVDGGEGGQRYSHPHSDAEIATGGGPGQGGNGADEEKFGQGYHSLSTPSIPHGGEPDGGMGMQLFQLLILILSSDNSDTSTIPHNVPEVPRPDESVESWVTADDGELGEKSVVSATGKLLREVRDSKNAFVPLKSIAGHLYSILENCQVWPPLYT